MTGCGSTRSPGKVSRGEVSHGAITRHSETARALALRRSPPPPNLLCDLSVRGDIMHALHGAFPSYLLFIFMRLVSARSMKIPIHFFVYSDAPCAGTQHEDTECVDIPSDYTYLDLEGALRSRRQEGAQGRQGQGQARAVETVPSVIGCACVGVIV